VTNLVVQNTSTGAGEDANAQVEYYDEEGNLDYTHTDITIAPKAVVEVKTEDETTLGDGWRGSAVMSADRGIAAIVSIKNTNVPGASDGLTQGAYNGSSEGATKLYFPSLFSFQYIVSKLSIQNTESTQATIYVTYYTREGAKVGDTVVDTVPAYSQVTYDMGVAADVPFTPDDAGTEFQDGSVVVTSTNALAGAAVTVWGNRFASYQALTDNNKGQTLYAPSHYRYMYDPTPYDPANPTAAEYTIFSAINVQNTNPSVTANVTATYVSRSDGSVSLTKVFTIPANSAAGLNTKNGGDFPATDFFDLTTGTGSTPDWDGSVTLDSDQPLVAICNTNWGVATNSGAYALVTENDGASTIFVPAQYRLDWGSGWAQWSALNLMNVGSSTVAAADISIEYIDTSGATVATFTGADLPGDLAAGAAVGLNTRNGGDMDASDFDSFGLSFIGGIYVSAPAGSQLVGVANIVYSNRASVYNCFAGD
jgi:hypothetical protein